MRARSRIGVRSCSRGRKEGVFAPGDCGSFRSRERVGEEPGSVLYELAKADYELVVNRK